MSEVKHGGCALCGDKKQDVLDSTTVGGNSLALCKKCAEQAAKGGAKA